MIVKNVTQGELYEALRKTNELYSSNVTFRRLDAVGKRFRFTLRVESSKGPGHKISYSAGPFGGKARNLAAACWHVHGVFFDKLLDIQPKAVIYSRGRLIEIYQDERGRHGNWQDFNIGSIAYSRLASESCGCKQSWLPQAPAMAQA